MSSTKVRLVRAMVFPVVMYECESWTIRKDECQRIVAFSLWCWRRLLRVPSVARSFNFSISPSREYSGLISFKVDWFDLLAVQGTLKMPRVFSNIIVQRYQFFGAKLSLWSNSHSYMTTGKTIALTRQTFVGKVMSLRFNMLSGLAIAFLPGIKRLLISWLQSPSAVILEPKKIQSVTHK